MPSSTPNQDYSFILKAPQQPQKNGFSLGSRGILFLAGAALIILVAVLVFASRGSNQTEVVGAAARATEIARVSDQIVQTTSDPDAKDLAATVSLSMNSEKAQLVSYLASNKTKVSTKDLAADQSSLIDTQLQTAAQNNSLSPTYYNYLKTNLALYQAELTSASKAVGAKGQAVIAASLSNIQVLLASPPLKS